MRELKVLSFLLCLLLGFNDNVLATSKPLGQKAFASQSTLTKQNVFFLSNTGVLGPYLFGVEHDEQFQFPKDIMFYLNKIQETLPSSKNLKPEGTNLAQADLMYIRSTGCFS